MDEQKVKVFSLGNGCEATTFLNVIGIRAKSPLDLSTSFDGQGYISHIFSGEFYNKILNRDFSRVGDFESKEIDNAGNWVKGYPKMTFSNGDSIFWPHICYSEFYDKVMTRMESFTEALNNPNALFAITNGQDDKFINEKAALEICKAIPDVQNRLIVICNGVDEAHNHFQYLGVPSVYIYTPLNEWYNIYYKDFFENCDERDNFFKQKWAEFCIKFPHIAKKVV